MPTYDYECGACGHAFEHFQSMSSRKLRKCPSCGEKKLERLFGIGSGVIFKGSGFYETDYKRAGSQRPKEESDGAGATESASSESSASAADGAPKPVSGDERSKPSAGAGGADAGKKAGQKD